MTIDWKRYVRARLPVVDVRPERENEIVDELALQLEAAYDTALTSGCAHEEAMRCAAGEVSDWPALARELARIESAAASRPRSLRAADTGGVMTGFPQDVRHAIRSLRHAPGCSIVATLTLALGLGLGAAAFSLVDAILLRPLTYGEPHRLGLVKATVPPEGRETVEITYPDAIDLAEAPPLASVSLLMPFAGTTTVTDPPSRIEGFEVSPSFFATIGVAPLLGRPFMPADGAGGPASVAIISHGLWERLGSPADIVGRTLAINEVPRTIVGVAPRSLRVDLIPIQAEVFLPLPADHPAASTRAFRSARAIARLADGASFDEASAAAAAIGSRLEQAYPETNRGRSFRVAPLQEEIVAGARSQLWLVAGLAALVLLVATVNFAGLLLARAVGRAREISLRLALGAGRWRLARESIAEGLMVSAAGAVAGAVLASAALDLVRTMPGTVLPRLGEIGVDYRTLAALGGAAFVIACAVGLVPLLLLGHLAPTSALRTGLETTGRPAMRVRAALVVGQTAFAFMLLAAAALLAASLRTVLAQPLGFETDHVVTMRISVPPVRYDSRDATSRFYTELLDSLRAQPMVRHAGVVSTLPLAGNTGSTLSIQGREDTPQALRPTVGWHWTSPGYFAAMGIPLLSGRDFTAEDLTRTQHVTIVNETLARQNFPGEDPIGKRVYFGGFAPGGPPEWHEVIGVVGDVRHRQLDAEPDARAYDLFGQHWGRTVSLAVRTADGPLQAAGVVRRLLAERDPRLAVFQVRTTADLVSEAAFTRRLLLGVVLAFAVVGLAVSLIGLYGTVSYMVAQRTREMGVRLALGATGVQVRRLVMRRGLQLVAAGIAIGLGGAFALRQAIEAQLFGVTAMDVPTLAAAAGALLAAAAIACLVPALRAMRINPVEALRAE